MASLLSPVVLRPRLRAHFKALATEFSAHSEELLKMGYDLRFQRIWRYYLDYCRVGFESQSTDVQLTLEHQL